MRDDLVERSAGGSGATPPSAPKGVEVSEPALASLAEALAAMRRRFPGVIPAAIHWGYVKHPLQPEQHDLLQAPPSMRRGKSMLNPLSVGLTVLRGLYLAGLCLFVRWTARRTLRALSERRFPVIIKTWMFGSQPPGGPDFYFGDLPERLRSRGIDVLLLCGNAGARSWRAFSRTYASAAFPARVPELALVPWWAPLGIAWAQIAAARDLRRAAHHERDPLQREILAAAAWASLRGQTATNALYFSLGAASVRRWHPGMLMTLLEGHAWERCFWRGVKTADPSCQTVGYQHTVLHPYNFAVLKPEPDPVEGPVPEVVLCLGERSQRQMSAWERGGARVLRFGSFRRPPQAASAPASRDRRAVLVTPEGRTEEVKRLFAFAVECARLLPDHRFILRAHPDLPMSEALRIAAVPPLVNIVLSEGRPIQDDFERAAWILYRGSSAALYAILAGLRPVYADIDTFIIDPLSDLGGWRRACRTTAEFAEVVRAREATPSDRESLEWRDAVAYAEAYVDDVGDDAIDQLMSAIGTGKRIDVEWQKPITT